MMLPWNACDEDKMRRSLVSLRQDARAHAKPRYLLHSYILILVEKRGGKLVRAALMARTERGEVA